MPRAADLSQPIRCCAADTCACSLSSSHLSSPYCSCLPPSRCARPRAGPHRPVRTRLHLHPDPGSCREPATKISMGSRTHMHVSSSCIRRSVQISGRVPDGWRRAARTASTGRCSDTVRSPAPPGWRLCGSSPCRRARGVDAPCDLVAVQSALPPSSQLAMVTVVQLLSAKGEAARIPVQWMHCTRLIR